MNFHSISTRVSSMSKAKKALTATASTVVVGGLVAGGAYALWAAQGAGSGSASSGAAVTVTVTASDGPTDLYPGFTEGDVYFTLTNDNDFPVVFTAATAGVVTPDDAELCPAANVTVAGATGLDLEVAANTTTEQLSIPDVVTMLASAPDDCQSMSFGVVLTLTGSQV